VARDLRPLQRFARLDDRLLRVVGDLLLEQSRLLDRARRAYRWREKGRRDNERGCEAEQVAPRSCYFFAGNL